MKIGERVQIGNERHGARDNINQQSIPSTLKSFNSKQDSLKHGYDQNLFLLIGHSPILRLSRYVEAMFPPTIVERSTAYLQAGAGRLILFKSLPSAMC